jgi:hypothetical protein
MPTPSRYSPALAKHVCKLIAQGHTLASLAERPEFPHRRTLWRWRRDRPEFAQMYDAACEQRPSMLRRLASSSDGRRACRLSPGRGPTRSAG